MSKPSLTMTAPGHMLYMPVAINFIESSVKTFGLSYQEISAIRLASEEAILIIIQYSLGNDPDNEYQITCNRLPGKIEISIRDKGIPFSPDEIPAYHPEKPDNKEGLSMFLLKNSVDEVQFRNLGRNGKETLLIKNISAEHIDNIPEKEIPEADKTEDIELNWKIRSFNPKDSIEISRCAYKTYGYTYEPYIYYPEMITDMNSNGKLLSLVAVDDNDTPIAHIALKFHCSEDPIAEIGVAFVKPEYRKLGIFSKMCLAAFSEAERKGMHGLFARAVSSHRLSQKKLNDFNFVDCGVILGLFPSDVDFKDLTGKTIQKESAILSYLPVESPKNTIFPPPRHKDIIKRIFNETSIPVNDGTDQETGSDLNGEDNIELKYSKIEVFNTADIICYSDDIKIVNDISAAMKKLCIEHVDVLYLYLNLQNPNCPEIANKCEDLGFFFSGILPYGLHGRHALILQFLNNIEIDFGNINVNSDFAAELLDYVKNCENEKIMNYRHEI